MVRRSLRIAILAAAALGATAVCLTGISGVATAAATSHQVSHASQQNYSTAVEKPAWSFACDSASKSWTFTINEVQVFDATGHTWNRSQGPWSVGVFASTKAGPVPFSTSATLHQNQRDGLFTAHTSGHASNAATWCQAGASVTVYAFSGHAQPLLLDGTLT